MLRDHALVGDGAIFARAHSLRESIDSPSLGHPRVAIFADQLHDRRTARLSDVNHRDPRATWGRTINEHKTLLHAICVYTCAAWRNVEDVLLPYLMRATEGKRGTFVDSALSMETASQTLSCLSGASTGRLL